MNASASLLAYRRLLGISGMSLCFFEMIGEAVDKIVFSEHDPALSLLRTVLVPLDEILAPCQRNAVVQTKLIISAADAGRGHEQEYNNQLFRYRAVLITFRVLSFISA